MPIRTLHGLSEIVEECGVDVKQVSDVIHALHRMARGGDLRIEMFTLRGPHKQDRVSTLTIHAEPDEYV